MKKENTFFEKLKKLPKKQTRSYYILCSAILFGIIALDLISKLICLKYLKPIDEITVIPGILDFTFVENEGMAFGLLADSRWIFILTSAVTVVLMLAYLYLGRAESKLYIISISMVAAGGLGNMVDRISLGYVVDFINFTPFDFWTYVFNIADAAVCVGAGLLVLALITDLIKEIKKGKEK